MVSCIIRFMKKLNLHVSYPRGMFNTKSSESFVAIVQALNLISKKVDELIHEMNELKAKQTQAAQQSRENEL